MNRLLLALHNLLLAFVPALPEALLLLATAIVAMRGLHWLNRLGLERARKEIDGLRKEENDILRSQNETLRDYNSDLEEQIKRISSAPNVTIGAIITAPPTGKEVTSP